MANISQFLHRGRHGILSVRSQVIEQREIAAGTVAISDGGDRCELLPQLGGCIIAWSVQGQAMLRTASAASIAARDLYGMASFPLVPYSNRIGEASFEWNGKRIELARNFAPEPHAIHGVGFERSWHSSERKRDSVRLTLVHQPDDSWPWAFEAQQCITIAEHFLTLDLSAVNLAPHPVPLAFGHHPYFPQAGALLSFAARAVWLVGSDGLPTEPVTPSGQFDFSQSMPVEHAEIDHCYTGWGGSSYITWPDKPWALQISGSRSLPCAVVCIRNGADAFCFEPVPHINNALNLRDHEPAIPIVAPGESFKASIRFRAVPR
ncbi:MAG: aldose 1-epimerase [Steroidobacteraceae bacterium]